MNGTASKPSAVAVKRLTGGSADLNLRVFNPISRYVRLHYGTRSLEQVAKVMGMRPDHLDGRTHWVRVEQVEAMLEAVRDLVPDDAAFEAACAFELRESLGPLRFALWATSPVGVQLWAIRHMSMVSRVSRYEVVARSPGRLALRYTSSKPEGRLLCLSRKAQGAALPTLWGLPPGVLLRESKCLARGDDACEYDWRFFQARAVLPPLGGAIVGAACTAGLGAMGVPVIGDNLLLPVVGLAVGLLVEAFRRSRDNARVGEEIVAGLRQLVLDSEEARRELLAIQEREREWHSLVEQQLAERTALVERIAESAMRERDRELATIRGVSHDIGTSLGVLRSTTDFLRLVEERLGDDGRGIVDDHSQAVDRMREMLSSVLSFANGRPGVRVVAERVQVAPLEETITRRLRALAYGRHLDLDVRVEREAPACIETDLLVLERILDNILSNAVKYTEVGSVSVTITGTPGYLTIKVADTGTGFDPKHASLLLMGGSARRPRPAPAQGFGVGLSVVVQLLGAIGGRLELMSEVGQGSTFWAHIPETIRPYEDSDDPGAAPSEKALLRKVVTIRLPFMAG